MNITRSSLLISSVAAAMVFTACSVERTSSPLKPSSASVSAAVTPTNSSSSSLVGTWVSSNSISTAAITSLPMLSSCSNFQLTIVSQTATSATGQFSAVCPGGLNVAGTITGQLGGATIPLVFTGVATQGADNCPFTLNGTGVPIGGDTFRVTYTGSSCIGPIQGTETLRLASTSPASPTPAPTPTPAPAPAPVPSGGDQFDLRQATVLGSDPAVLQFPVTASFDALSFSPGVMTIRTGGTAGWPLVPIESGGEPAQAGTLWIFLSIGGRIYGTGAERLRPSQLNGDKPEGSPATLIGEEWLYDQSRWGPMAHYRPSSGELVGAMVVAGSTRSDNNTPLRARTNAIVIRWP